MGDDDLLWGVRGSFLRYVEAVGDVDVEAPATRDADGRLRFPLAGSTGGTRRYAGGVRFRAHHGALALTIAYPWVEPREGGQADLTVRGTDGAPEGRVRLATIGPDGAAQLADEGVPLFDFEDPPGTALDPLAFATRGSGLQITMPPDEDGVTEPVVRRSRSPL